MTIGGGRVEPFGAKDLIGERQGLIWWRSSEAHHVCRLKAEAQLDAELVEEPAHLLVVQHLGMLYLGRHGEPSTIALRCPRP